MLPAGKRSSKVLLYRYGQAVVLTGLAWLVRWLSVTYLGTKSPYFPFTVAVIVTALYAGWGPAVVATLLGVVVARSLVGPEPSHPGAFVVIALIIVWAIEMQHRVRRRLAAEIE